MNKPTPDATDQLKSAKLTAASGTKKDGSESARGGNISFRPTRDTISRVIYLTSVLCKERTYPVPC
ncbi:MAG: hypothetical protein A2840_02245 [Candidatus Buchananbacteria bacterium RIFCSPHIGHO2_01_FULL_47_11b]|uniref:Uncharacterized protein n=1 Tax=Candidatus Buchananbacteria bacterium RIFCSPHIGHO2_01_FULL_47_11b TaxID=1797537 RepID=A0A1G1Y779_9BACT|nr:MAG: hypothetical protein A2840_02245 [Candidatus Buchananbacteria bacterium RIFCSPHIGHO2_01_FULL_47_11b]